MLRSTKLTSLAVAGALVLGLAGSADAREAREGSNRNGSTPRTSRNDGPSRKTEPVRTQKPEQVASKAASEPKSNQAASRADAAIARRLETLSQLVKKVESADNIRAADRTALLGVLNAQQTGLTDLRTKIAATTDQEALKALVRSIVDDYRVYLLTVPKVRMVLAASKALGAASKLDAAAAKLQSKIDGLPAGTDVTAAQDAVDAMRASVAKGRSLVEGVPAQVIPLQAKDYPGNRDALMQAGKALKSGVSALKDARKQGHSALELLKKVASL